jgi:hypothetical protein
VTIRVRKKNLIRINADKEEQGFPHVRAVEKILEGATSPTCFFTVRRRSQEGPLPEDVSSLKGHIRPRPKPFSSHWPAWRIGCAGF